MDLLKKLTNYSFLMRFHQPIGIYLLLIPCLWSLVIFSSNGLDIKLLIIFIIGSIITRSSGCIVNDLVDIKIDRLVERTKNRPLTSGEVTIWEALILLALLCVVAVILLLFLSKEAVYIALIAPFLVILYPFMKRITYFPQVILGITFNLGVLMANAALTGKVTLSGIYLYIAAIFWSLGYDTVYAHQDKIDDQQIGLKSTALILNKFPKLWISSFYILMLVFLIRTAGLENLNNIFIILCVGNIIWFLIKLRKLDLNNPNECAKNFKSNSILGSMILLSILASK
ncbi:MAG: 4-hydroxybenzoate octaprenyltransferase [Alphaproteobacteria bacterium]